MGFGLTLKVEGIQVIFYLVIQRKYMEMVCSRSWRRRRNVRAMSMG